MLVPSASMARSKKLPKRKTPPIKNAIVMLAAAVKSGQLASSSTTCGFAQNLCRTFLRDPSAWEAMWDGLNEELSGNYARNFRRWVDAVAPDGIMLARGMHDIPMGTAEEILAFIRPGQRADESYSQNLAVAANEFAVRGAYEARDVSRLGGGMGGEAMVKRQESQATKLRERTLGRGGWNKLAPSKQAAWLNKHYGATVTIVKLTPTEAGSFGGDSESGDLQEAELRVGKFPMKRVLRVFALSATPIKGAKLTSLEEQRRFALCQAIRVTVPRSDTRSQFDLLLHAGAREDVPDGYGVKSVRSLAGVLAWQAARYARKARKLPTGPARRWYTLCVDGGAPPRP